MTYLSDVHQPTVLELARQGNLRALTYWINSYLVPQGIYARLQPGRSGYLHIQVELPRVPDLEKYPGLRSERLARFICHRLCKLNSGMIERVRIATRFAGDTEDLWRQSIRLVTPGTRARSRQTGTLRARLQHVAERRARLKLFRSFLLSGSTVAAFILGCWLGYSDAPPDQAGATASPASNAETTTSSVDPRPDTIQTALQTVPVIQQQAIADPTDPTATLLFGGDVTLADAFADLIGQDYTWAFAEMDEYRKADIAMVNLENPLTRADTLLPDKQFNFKADPDSVQVLLDGGVDIVTLANNHAMDYDEPGLTETIDTLERAGIRHIGAGRDITEARRPQIMEVKGQRIAFLGYYDADLHAAGEGTAGTNPRHNDRVAEDIKAIRNQVDWIIVNYHWGEEKSSYPGDWQVDLAHFTIDQGADLVVGHHPHVLQGAEIYKGRPIAYSLGNFIFGGNSRSDYDTAVLKVSLRDQQMKVEFLPVEVRKYQPKVVTGDRADEILQHIQDISQNFEQPMVASMVLNARPAPTQAATETPTPTPTAAQPAPVTKPPTESFINSPNSTPIDDKKLRLEDIDWVTPQPAPTPVEPMSSSRSSEPVSLKPSAALVTTTISDRQPSQTVQPQASPQALQTSQQTDAAPEMTHEAQNGHSTQQLCEQDTQSQRLEPWWKCYMKAESPHSTQAESSALLEAPWAFAGM